MKKTTCFKPFNMDSGTGIGGHSKNIEEMTTSKLDLFSPIIVEKGVEKSYRVIYHPNSYFGSTGPFEFTIQPDPEKYIDIQSAILHGKVQIFKKNQAGVWVALVKLTDKKVALVNNGLQSLWSNVIIKINDTEIGDSGENSYAYAALIQILLGAKESCKDTILKSRQFFKEEFPAQEPEKEEGFKQRNLLAGSGWMEMNIPLHNDLMTATRYLPPNTKLSISLKRTTNNFCLHQLDDEEYNIEIKDLRLSIVKYSVNEAILNYYLKTMKTVTPTVPYTKNVFKTYPITQGNYDLSNHNLFFGNRLPERVYIMMVDQDRFNGNKKKSPYMFEFMDMKDACLMVNGVSEPSTPYSVDATNYDTLDLYYQFLENTGTSPFEMDSVWISYEDFYWGHFILAFDRSPTKDNGLYTHKMEGGHMGIRMHTRTALTKNIQVLVYASYSSKLEFVEDKVVLEIP